MTLYTLRICHAADLRDSNAFLGADFLYIPIFENVIRSRKFVTYEFVEKN